MDRVRQVRDQIQEKRAELSRLDRALARERQLRGQSADEPRTAPSLPPATSDVSPSGVRPKASPAAIPGRSALTALRSAKIADRAEYSLVQGLAEGLTSDDAEMRRQAVVKLGARPHPVVSLLLLGADDPEDSVRLAALGALTGQRHPSLPGLFRRFLRDKNAALRLAALRGLASIDDPQVTHNDLVASLEDSDAGVRRVAASVLSWHREDAKMPLKTMHALGLALYDEDEAVRISAAEALGTAGDDRAVLALIRSVGDPSEGVSKAAQRSLHSLVGPEIDSVAEGAPAAERVEGLKAWWRTARVRLRGGPAAGGATVESASWDVKQTLATMKGTGQAVPAAAASAAAKAETQRGAPPAQAKAEPAQKAKPAAPAPEAKAAPAPEPKPAPEVAAAAGKAAEAAPAAAPEEGKEEFESMFQETEEKGDAGEEGYETLLGDKS
jgi:HEAT repeat protein